MDLTLFTVIVGHATFCIVVVYNNAVARLRRTGMSLEEAANDLGAGPWRTFRDVTFPQMRTALVAGALLAFALSFDEIIVTTFTAGSQETLPIWIFTNYSRPNQLPIVNVVGLTVIVLSIIPVYLANRLSQDPVGAPGVAAGAGAARGAEAPAALRAPAARGRAEAPVAREAPAARRCRRTASNRVGPNECGPRRRHMRALRYPHSVRPGAVVLGGHMRNL